MNLSVSLLFAMALFIMATAQDTGCQKPLPNGEPFPADLQDPKLLAAVDFAVADSYEMDTTTYTVLTGTEQTVSGTVYNLDVAVTETSDGYCTVFNYVISVAGDPEQYELQSSNELTDRSC